MGVPKPPVPETRFRFHVLGPFAVVRDGAPLTDAELGSRKERLLLKLLVAERDHVVASERAAQVLWGEDLPERPSRAIATLVSRLRRLLGPAAIAGGPSGYRLVPGPGLQVDQAEAERLVGEAESRLAAGQASVSAAAAERALDLLARGIPFEDEPYAEWAEPARHAAADLAARARRCAWEAASAVSDFGAAARWAETSIAADPLDEEAHRALMLARHRGGESGRALDAFERLKAILAEGLGADPSGETLALHTSILRGQAPAGETQPRPEERDTPAGQADFVGRDEEEGRLAGAWAEALAGSPALVVIAGEAGMGKTALAGRLAQMVERTGGMVAMARCYQAERSLFLQPVADALRSALSFTPPEVLRDAAGEWSGTLADLVPDLGPILRPFARRPSAPDIERRRTFEAVTAFLRGVQRRQPVLLFLDDLHNAGSSTFELLHSVLRRLGPGRLMVLATARSEEAEELRPYLAGLGTWLELGGLPDQAVEELARRSGAEGMARRILERTRGHTLFVVETLRAIREQGTEADREPLPDTLRDAVVARVRAAGEGVEGFLRGAATLGWAFDLDVAASLLDLRSEEAGRFADSALRARLLVEAGPVFEFANELIRDILYETTPGPTRVARHRRAAALLADNPEAAAGHAEAAGEWATALAGWLRAADQASARYANTDAEAMLALALQAARNAGDPLGEARARLARGELREALPDYRGAYADLWSAIERARVAGDRAIEMRALRTLGGDVLVGLGRPTADCLPYLQAALAIAEDLSDVPVQVDGLGRMAIIWANRLRFDLATDLAHRAVRLARKAGDDRVLAWALDAVKTSAAYSGDLGALESVLPELQAILRRRSDLWRLQWSMFEAAFPPMARGEWDRAERRIEEALSVNRRSGYRQNLPMFLPHLVWIARARGEYGRALALGREAVELAGEVRHPWGTALACMQLGSLLLELQDVPGAARVLDRGLAAAERDGAESYLVRCVGPAAQAAWRLGDTGRAATLLDRADALMAEARTPTGSAFLLGAEAYGAVAETRLGLGDAEGAGRTADRLADEARTAGWKEATSRACIVSARCRMALGDRAGAEALFTEASAVAEEAGLPALRWRAHAGLAATAVDLAAREGHRRAARGIVDGLAATIDDAEGRRRFLQEIRTTLGGDPEGWSRLRATPRSGPRPEQRRPSPRRGT